MPKLRFDLVSEDWHGTIRGILVASPVLLFPFSRLYTAGLIALLIVAALQIRWPIESVWPLPAPYRPLLWGVLAIAGPVVLTCLVLPLSGSGFELLWLRNLLTIFTAALFAFATIRVLAMGPRVKQVALALIAATVIFWLLDGLIQFGFGRDVFGIPLQEGRVGIYFSNPRAFGYFIPFFSVFPVFWCMQFRRGWLFSLLVLLTSGVVTLAANSRYAMLAYALLAAVFALLSVQALPSHIRIAVLISSPIILMGLTTGVYQLNTSFRLRWGQTLAVVQQAPSYEVLDRALSHRLEIWQHSWTLIKAHPLFGIGPGQFRAAVADMLFPSGIYYQKGIQIMHAHQVLLEIALGTGVIGVLAFLIYYRYLLLLFWSHRFAWRESIRGQGLAGLVTFLLFWFPLGSHKNFYGSEQLFIAFYFLALGFAVLPSAPRLVGEASSR